MSLSRKFIFVLVGSIILIAVINLVAFSAFYTTYTKSYIAEKIQAKDKITIEYVNEIIEKQTIDDIDNIFNDAEIDFFELLEDNAWEIPLEDQSNTDIVINYLVKSWVTPKYIEEIIPSNSFEKVLWSLQDRESSEYQFLKKLSRAIVFTNIFSILLIIWGIFIFTKKTILPIKEVTGKIKRLRPGRDSEEIKYEWKDEIWLLIKAINGLNKKLNVQQTIRSRLLADISHELKTPITSIQCYLEWISDWVIKLNEKNLASITDEMTRLITLVNTIMQYESFENQDLELHLKEENLPSIIKSLVETHKKRLKENKQKIKVVWIDELIMEIDKDLFSQIIHNVIGNFLKYAGNNSTMTVNVTKNYIDFKDDWVWVKSKEIPFLMEKFYQGKDEKSGDIKERGIGVWLSIVKKILDAHDWDVSIKSSEWKWFSFKIKF